MQSLINLYTHGRNYSDTEVKHTTNSQSLMMVLDICRSIRHINFFGKCNGLKYNWETNTNLTVHKIFSENVVFKDSNEELHRTRQGGRHRAL